MKTYIFIWLSKCNSAIAFYMYLLFSITIYLFYGTREKTKRECLWQVCVSVGGGGGRGGREL